MQELELSQLIEGISNGRIQETLALNYEGLNDEQIVQIISILQSNITTLQMLDLSGNQIGDSGAEAIAVMLQHNTTLQALDLSHNQIEDSGAEALAKVLEQNTALQTLDLRSNQIGDSGAEALAGGLEHNATLQTLDLSYNVIWENGIKAIAKALEHNATLQALDLSNWVDNEYIYYGLLPRVESCLSFNRQQVIAKRNNFIQVLIVLARDHANQGSASHLAILPKEIKLHILSLINFTSVDSIGKTPKQIYQCAKFIFEHIKEFNVELPNSNGFQIKENINKSLASEERFKFLFFKGPKYKSNDIDQEAKKKNIASLEFK